MAYSQSNTHQATPTTVRALIDQQAMYQLDNIYLTAPSAHHVDTLSYAQLKEHAQILACYFAQQGIRKGDKVAMLLDNGYWACSLFLGVMYSGAVIVPMNAVAGHQLLSYVLTHSDTRLLFISPHYAKQYQDMLNQSPRDLNIIVLDEAHFDLHSMTTTPPHSEILAHSLATIKAHDPAILIYTSGTTGKPKGVLLSQRNVLAGGRNTVEAHQLTAADCGLCVLPLYHINAEMVSIISTLISGGRVVLPKRFSVSHFWSCLIQYQCNWFSIVPTMVAYLLDHAERVPLTPQQQTYLREQVRFGRSASAPLSPEIHQQFEQHFSVSLIETMGLTETSAQILANPLPPQKIKYGSPGIPFGNEARIVNTEGQECPRGVSGELMIRGDNVMLAYYKNEQATQETLTPEGWLHTGDLAMQDNEGYFFITGRLKELIIKGGENISPREIDEALYNHPAVLEAAAFAVPHRTYGQDIMAGVVLRQNALITPAALKEHIQQQLGSFKTPTNILILDALPKGPSGKVQRLKLAENIHTSFAPAK